MRNIAVSTSFAAIRKAYNLPMDNREFTVSVTGGGNHCIPSLSLPSMLIERVNG